MSTSNNIYTTNIMSDHNQSFEQSQEKQKFITNLQEKQELQIEDSITQTIIYEQHQDEYFIDNNELKQNQVIIQYESSDDSQIDYLEEDIKTYFQASKNIQYQYHKIIYKKIKKDILSGNLFVRKISKAYNLTNDKNKFNINEKNIRKELQEQRKETQQKLRQIKKQQFNIKIEMLNKERHKSQKQLILVTVPSKEEKKRIKKTLEFYQQFDHNMKNRTQIFRLQIRDKLIQENKLRERQIEIQKQMKRQQIKKNLIQLKQREKTRSKIIQEWKHKELKLKDRKYKYVQYSNQQKRKINKEEKQRQQKLQQIHREKKLDIEAINQHEKKYQQLIKSKRNQYRLNSVPNLHTYRHSDSYFTKLVKKELRETKQKQELKFGRVHEHDVKQRIQNYQKYIDENFKPIINLKNKFDPMIKSYSLNALSTQEKKQKGLQYLKIAKKLKKDFSLIEKQKNQHQIEDKVKKIDYLRQNIKNKKHYSTQDQFNKLVGQGKFISDYNLALKAQNLVEKLQYKTKKVKDDRMYLLVKNKLQLLEALSHEK